MKNKYSRKRKRRYRRLGAQIIVPLLVMVLTMISSILAVSKIEPADSNDFVELLRRAKSFNEEYLAGSNEDAFKMADDHVYEDNQTKVLFENDKAYVVLSYDSEGRFIEGKKVDKSVTLIGKILIVLIASAVSFFITYLVVFFYNDERDKLFSRRKKEEYHP